MRSPAKFFLVALFLTRVLTAQNPLAVNYAEALQKSVFFYQGQRSGHLPNNNPINWRGDSGLTDGSDVGVDLTGGWYDAGDNMKFGFPMAGSATMLAWGLIEYSGGYTSSQQMAPMVDNLRWATDYFMRASATPNQLWGQVGTGGLDHAWWGPAEAMSMPRPAYRITVDCPGTDLAGETAAALAAASIVFKNRGDTQYAVTLLTRAQSLYQFAEKYLGKYSDCITDANAFYKSWSGYADELVWGAAWLYRATGDAQYLSKAAAYYDGLSKQSGSDFRSYTWTHSWDDKSYGSYVLMSQLTGDSKYRADAERWLDFWTTGFNGQRITYTPGGLAWLDSWASLRYAANTAFLAFLYSDYLQSNQLDPARGANYRAFAERQINYMLGDNPRRSSYVMGFGANPPRNPHHRTAHGSWADDINSPTNSVHTLYGAMVGGPDQSDSYADVRTDYVKNEVATDYNAAFSGALAKLVQVYGGTPLPNFPPPETPSRDELFVQAMVNSRGTNYIEVAAYLNNQTAWPARVTAALSLRYFFRIDSDNPSDVSLTTAYNQCGSVTGPVRWSPSVFYLQVDCTNVRIAPSGQSDYRKQAQFRITGSGPRDPSNDWSFAGLDTAGSNLVKVSKIVMYDGGVKVWGDEPPGGIPQPLSITTPTALPGGAVGQPYSLTLRASGGNAPYQNWQVVQGSLPDGLSLDATTGQINGTPTSASNADFVVSVSDKLSLSSTREFTLNVSPAPPLSVTPPGLPTGYVGLAYAANLVAAGGISPYVWSVTTGQLPSGLQLTGASISGTPQSPGTASFTATVTDSTGSSVQLNLTLEVDPAPLTAVGTLRVQYRTSFADIGSNQIGPQFKIFNTGTAAIPLSQLTVRYYFTPEDPQPLNSWCDYAVINCANVTTRFVDLGSGNFYLENSFTVTAGVVPSGGDSGEIQNRFAKDNWSNFDQSNDYSFDKTKQVFADWNHVTLYQNGILVWGVEPTF